MPHTLDRITTHIDPHAEKPPHDVCVVREVDKSLALSTAEESRKHLHQLRTGQAINPLMAVLRAASDEVLSGTCEALLSELTALSVIHPSLRPHRVMELLTPLDQRIFNLMREGIQGFAKSAVDLPKPVYIILDSFIKADDGQPRGIAPASEAALHIAKACLADAIQARIDNGTLDTQTLADILGGNEGFALVLRALTDIIASALPR